MQEGILIVKLFKMLPAILARTGWLYLAAVGVGDELRPVADAEDRIFPTDFAEVDLERFFIVDREWTSRKYHSYHRRVIVRKFVVGKNLAIRVQFAHPSPYELGCLRAEVEDYDFLLHRVMIGVLKSLQRYE